MPSDRLLQKPPSGRFSSGRALATSCAALLLADHTAEALPSFGTKIPNGESVPCPPDLLGDVESSSGCTPSGYCFGLGHPDCGGFRPEDKIVDETGANPPAVLLNPFGEDWRSNGFVWTKELCELDSDGDGYTNGEELGDPCCVWTYGTSSEAVLDSIPGFLPSHPGMARHTPPEDFDFDSKALCNIINDNENEEDADTDIDETEIEEDDPYDQYYNPEERREYFEFVMKPYPIPVQTTTYVDFHFNIPEDAPDLFHVVFGEPIISQPDHLHHFVINGCASRFDPSKEGIPLDVPVSDCQVQLLGQWAPGSELFGRGDLNAGVILGRGMGIEALQLNIHYTDGAYADPTALTQKMATDGIRVHYTPDFRPHTISRLQLVNVPYGPPELFIPPNASRYFLSKTCNVGSACRDTNDHIVRAYAQNMDMADVLGAAGVGVSEEMIASMLEDVTCSILRMFCFTDGQIGNLVQRLCPATCGLCEGGVTNSRTPDSYLVTAVNYHAHLLGREMYTTLVREERPSSLEGPPLDTTVVQKKQAPQQQESRLMVRDMKSREVWYYDDQADIPMDYDISVSATEDAAETALVRGVEVRPGDKIHMSCVYDSTGRTEATSFGLSTYDEMCLNSLLITFETPPGLLNSGDDPSSTGIGAAADLALRRFTCEVDYEERTTDVHQGFLEADEDGRNIWLNHPIQDSDMCIFPMENYVLVDSFMTRETRNCPVDVVGSGDGPDDGTAVSPGDGPREGRSSDMCSGMRPSNDVEFLEDAIAGYRCQGGWYDQRDSNEIPDCFDGGGTGYTTYTCSEAERWLLDDTKLSSDTLAEYYRTAWWQDKCCRHIGGDSVEPSSAATRIASITAAAVAAIDLMQLLVAIML